MISQGNNDATVETSTTFSDDKDENETVDDVSLGEFMPHSKPSEAALHFLESIDNRMLELCCFEDKLAIVSEDGKTVGAYKACVKFTKLNEELALFVRASTQANVESTATGSSLTAYLLPETLTVIKQEHRQFFRTKENLEKLTKFTLDRDNEKITCYEQITKHDKTKAFRITFKKYAKTGLVTEATNIVLQRLMIKAGLEIDRMDFVSLDLEERCLVNTTYTTLPKRKQTIGEKKVVVQGIERILPLKQVPFTWHSYYAEDASLTFRIQVGSPLTMILEQLPPSIKVQDEIPLDPKPVFRKKRLMVNRDMEMNSKFIQRKSELKAKHDTFLEQHPEVKALLSDFLNFLLLRRPEDVLDFASSYFSSLSTVSNDDQSLNFHVSSTRNPFFNPGMFDAV